MIKLILSFFRPDLGKVLSQFEKTIAKLNAVEAHERAEAEKAAARIAAAQARQQQAEATINRADAVRSNLRNIVGE